MKATVIVHWPGRDTAACDLHARRLRAVALILSFELSVTPCDAVVECTNCANEKAKLLASEQQRPGARSAQAPR